MSTLIRLWAEQKKHPLPPLTEKTLESVKALQNAGDLVREKDPSGVARLCLAAIAAKRAALTGQEFKQGEAVEPDQEKRAWLIDSSHASQQRGGRRPHNIIPSSRTLRSSKFSHCGRWGSLRYQRPT